MNRRFFSASKDVVTAIPEMIRRELAYRTGKKLDAILCLTWGCTSRCTTCSVWRRDRMADKELSLDEWLSTAEQIAALGIRSVELFGGDIFLRKDVVFELCEKLNSLGVDNYLPMNGNLVDRETSRVLAKTTKRIYLSLDGLDDTHDQIRGIIGTYQRIRNALEYLKAARGDRTHPKLICNTTVSRRNVEQIYDLAAAAAEAGFDEIDFSYVGEFSPQTIDRSTIDEYKPSPIYIQAGESSLVPQDLIGLLRKQLIQVRSLEKHEDRGRFHVKTLYIDLLSDRQIADGTVPTWRRCFMERTTLVMDPYGNIAPCIFFDTFAIGNIREGSLETFRNSPRQKYFRKFRDNGRLEMCKRCSMSVPRNWGALDYPKRAWLSSRIP